MIGIRNDEVIYVPFADAIRSDKPMNKNLIKVLDQLSIWWGVLKKILETQTPGALYVIATLEKFWNVGSKCVPT